MDNKQFLIEMGNRISKQRKQLNLTQEQLAEKIGLSLQSISCIELGKKAVRPENLVNLSKALNVSADYILTGQKSQNQLEGITKNLSSLNDDDFEIVKNLIDHFNKTTH